MTLVNIIGSGGHGKMLEGIIHRDHNFMHPVRVSLWDSEATPDNDGWVIIGLGNLVKIGDPGLAPRKRLYKKFNDGQLKGVIDPSAVVIGYAWPGAQIMPGAIIQTGAEVHRNCIINTGAIIEHHATVMPHCHIAPRATLCGRVLIGEGTHVGAGSVIRQGITVGMGCVIAMGSVVTKDVPHGKTWLRGEII